MYKDLITIDNVVKRSMGAYTHDDVWYTNVVTVMNLSLLYYEQDMLTERRHSLNQQLKPK